MEEIFPVDWDKWSPQLSHNYQCSWNAFVKIFLVCKRDRCNYLLLKIQFRFSIFLKFIFIFAWINKKFLYLKKYSDRNPVCSWFLTLCFVDSSTNDDILISLIAESGDCFYYFFTVNLELVLRYEYREMFILLSFCNTFQYLGFNINNKT